MVCFRQGRGKRSEKYRTEMCQACLDVLDVFYEVEGPGKTEGTPRCAQKDHQTSFDGHQVIKWHARLRRWLHPIVHGTTRRKLHPEHNIAITPLHWNQPAAQRCSAEYHVPPMAQRQHNSKLNMYLHGMYVQNRMRIMYYNYYIYIYIIVL